MELSVQTRNAIVADVKAAIKSHPAPEILEYLHAHCRKLLSASYMDLAPPFVVRLAVWAGRTEKSATGLRLLISEVDKIDPEDPNHTGAIGAHLAKALFTITCIPPNRVAYVMQAPTLGEEEQRTVNVAQVAELREIVQELKSDVDWKEGLYSTLRRAGNPHMSFEEAMIAAEELMQACHDEEGWVAEQYSSLYVAAHAENALDDDEVLPLEDFAFALGEVMEEDLARYEQPADDSAE